MLTPGQPSVLLRFTATVYFLGNVILLDICMYDCMSFSRGAL
jgi:hypothetical protein